MKSNFSLTELSQNSSDRGLADSVREKGSRLSPLFHMRVAAGAGGEWRFSLSNRTINTK